MGNYSKKHLESIRNSENINLDSEQIKRQKSAIDKKCTPISIDFNNKTGIFSGSGKTPYNTAIDSCSCRDFILRKLPCKHIYRLLHELNLFSLNEAFPDDFLKISSKKSIDEAMELVSVLPESMQILYRDICYCLGNDNSSKTSYPLRSSDAEIFIKENLLVETRETLYLFNHCRFNDVKKVLRTITKDPLPRTKRELMDYVIKNYPDMVLPLDSNVKYLILPEDISHLAMTIRKRLYKKFPIELEETQ